MTPKKKQTKIQKKQPASKKQINTIQPKYTNNNSFVFLGNYASGYDHSGRMILTPLYVRSLNDITAVALADDSDSPSLLIDGNLFVVIDVSTTLGTFLNIAIDERE